MMRPGRPPARTPPLALPPDAAALLALYAEHLPRLRGAAYRVLVTLALCGGVAPPSRVTQRSGLCDRAARVGVRDLEGLGLLVRESPHRRCTRWVCALQGQAVAAGRNARAGT
jgi:hypothetical protein